MKEVIAYYRRSTEQGQQYSLEAQKLAVEDFCREHGLHIIATFQETCSGKSIHRPKLKQAIQIRFLYLLQTGTRVIIIMHMNGESRE